MPRVQGHCADLMAEPGLLGARQGGWSISSWLSSTNVDRSVVSSNNLSAVTAACQALHQAVAQGSERDGQAACSLASGFHPLQQLICRF